MSYLVLARKWRPQRFTEVIGQRHVVRTLENAIRSGRIAHAYIFSGPRGVGKTSIARILAKSLNCAEGPTPEPCGVCRSCQDVQAGSHFDVIEIDGASNKSVNDIRELRANVKYGPGESRWKVYIIDEVHMLSTSAFNALLKTLEEPPPNTVFIFATTELHKLPLTVLSRCQRFDFKRLTPQEIEESLTRVCASEEVRIEPRTLRLIARRADGGMRDAQSMLDQVLSFSEGEVSHEEVVQALGLVGQERLDQVLEALRDRDGAAALRLARDLSAAGTDLAEFLLQLADQLRHLLLVRLDPAGAAAELPEDLLARLGALAPAFPEDDLVRMLGYLGGQIEAIRRGGHPRLRFELTLLRLVRMEQSLDLQDLLRTLAGLPAESLGAAADGEAKKSPARAGPDLIPPRPETAISTPDKDTRPAPPGQAGRALAPPAGEQEPAVVATPPVDLARLRELWPAFQEAVERDFPLLLDGFLQVLPVGLGEGRLVLKGELGGGLIADHLRQARPQLEALLGRLLGGAAPTLEFKEGALSDEERFLKTRRTHLDSRSRFDELRREAPLVEDLFARMEGRLLDG
ncbi:MAG: DNA polymerase III subunit gamma/tau [bacterium]|nr:DNA polymerase III subunit gamma/tau [bacterium]